MRARDEMERQEVSERSGERGACARDCPSVRPTDRPRAAARAGHGQRVFLSGAAAAAASAATAPRSSRTNQLTVAASSSVMVEIT